ncbi:RNA methyltransferase [Amylibacter kogurei]|uniref:RNA methyltransferase n=1 Tax=Paramylibacter kogurei TaxID=1889778 RepID=A0A2G5KBS1_9RHOB|nr:class I SAM-dependent RNA methyltransferase [Amylibacter kogurei]PIB26502.1 RNA methyltransferase [Amylibacter kogurei]
MVQTLRIEKLGHQGNGVSSLHGMDIFVPYSLPGELVEGEIDGDEIAKARILEPVETRVKAPCRHFKTCGGCALQHASDAFVAKWKQQQVQTVLELEGLSPDFRPIATSPTASRRRATFTGRRGKKGAMIGFYARGSDTLIEITECHLVEPALLAGFAGMKELVMIGASRKIPLRIATTNTKNGLDIDVTEGKDLTVEQSAALGGIADTHGFARITWNGEVVVQSAPPVQTFGAATVIPPSDAFLQATHHGEKTLVDAALLAIGPAKRVIDLFSGCGTFALNAAKIAEVHAVEGSASMIHALDAGWRGAAGLKTVTSEVRDLYARPYLPDELNKFDAAIIDPPRAGALSQTQELAKSNINHVAFVSCNPATFSRDAKLLCRAGFRLDWVQVVDQFRWSSHVELVAQFTRS